MKSPTRHGMGLIKQCQWSDGCPDGSLYLVEMRHKDGTPMTVGACETHTRSARRTGESTDGAQVVDIRPVGG